MLKKTLIARAVSAAVLAGMTPLSATTAMAADLDSAGSHLTASIASAASPIAAAARSSRSTSVIAQNGSSVSLAETDVTSSATAIKALSGSTINLSDVTAKTLSNYAHGVEASGIGSSVSGSDVTATTQGKYSYGFRATGGGTVSLTDINATTSGDFGHGVIADTADSHVVLWMADIVTDGGTYAMGARAADGGVVDIYQARIATYGGGAYGVNAIGSQSQMRVVDVDVETFGGEAAGTTASGAVAEWGGLLDVQNSRITTHGDSSIGLLAQVSSTADDADTVLNAGNVRVKTTGEAAFGAMACALIPGHNDSCAGSAKSGQVGEGARAEVRLNESDIQTVGAGSHGLYAYGPAGAQILANNTTVATTGEGAHGVVSEAGADVQLSNSLVTASGLDAAGATVISSRLAVSGGILASAQGSALRTDAGTIALSAGVMAAGGNGVFAEQVGNATSVITMEDDAIAIGDITLGSGAAVGATRLALSRQSSWNGKSDGVISDLSIASGSRWYMTGDSTVGPLALQQGTVAFEEPSPDQFKTLTVAGDFDAEGGLLVMNTALGDDGSATDRMHVLGNTNGAAEILINNVDGKGGLTVDGIRLIEVDGKSDAQFSLAGRVVAGAYEYSLHQGTKASPSNGNWYLRSELPTPPVAPPETPSEPDPLPPVAPPVIPSEPEPTPPVAPPETPSEPGPTPPVAPPETPSEPDPTPPVAPPVTPPAPGPAGPTDPKEPDAPAVPGTPQHQLRPEAGVYLVNQAAAVGMFDIAMHDRIGEPNLVAGKDSGTNGVAGWVRTSSDHANGALLDQLQARTHHHVLQAGADLGRWGDASRGVVGVMIGTGEASTTVTSDSSGYVAQGRVKGRSAGVYGSWVSDPVGDGGAYVDSWAQLGRYRNQVQGQALQAERYDSSTRSASLEAGYALPLRKGPNSAVYIEPQAQLTWSDYDLNGAGHEEANGTHVAAGKAGGLRSRVGVRVFGHTTAEGMKRVQPYLTANWYRHHGATNSVWLDDVSLNGAEPKYLYEVKGGLQLQLRRGLTAWGEINASRGGDDYRKVGAMMGVKYDW